VMEEIAQLVPMYQGISHQRLESSARIVFRPDPSNPMPTQILYSDKEYPGVQWPTTDQTDHGTAVLYTEGFPSETANLMVPEFRAAKPALSEDYPFLFVPGRVLLQEEREMEVIRGQTNSIKRDEIVELSSVDAKKLGIQKGDLVEVLTSGQRFEGKASLNGDWHDGIISSTSLFGQLAVEMQASEQPDPMSRVPTLVVQPAKVSKITPK